MSPCFPILHLQCSNLVANRVYWNIHKPCYISILRYQEQFGITQKKTYNKQFGMLSSERKSTTCISPIHILNQSQDQDRHGMNCLGAQYLPWFISQFVNHKVHSLHHIKRNFVHSSVHNKFFHLMEKILICNDFYYEFNI